MSGGGKQKTSQSTTENSTSAVTLPAWMTAAGQQNFQNAQAYSQAHPVQGYGQPIAAGMSGNQQAAQAAAQQGAAAGQADLNSARTMAARSTGAPAPQVGVQSFGNEQAQQYMSPFLKQVQDSTVGEMHRQNAMEMQGLGDSAAASKAFGGTRHAVESAETSGRQNANIMDYLARSNQAAYENAQGQFNNDRAAKYGADTFNAGQAGADRDRELQASGLYGQLAGQAGGLSSDNIRNLLLSGQVAQDTDNSRLGSAYDEFLRMQDAPMQRFGDLSSILQGTPRNVTTTGSGTSNSRGTTSTGGSTLSTIMGLASIAASAASDERLKENIVHVGEEPDGLPIYEYDYINEPWLPRGRFRGPMASDVARLRPWELRPEIHGFQTINAELRRVA